MSKMINYAEVESAKPFSCFICSKNSSEKGLPLLISETTHSRICLGEKLQEILGDKLVILLSQKDSVCWKCATHINRFDKFEYELDLIKDYVLNSLLEKYNCKLEDVTRFIQDGPSNDISDAVPQSLDETFASKAQKQKPGLLKSSTKAKPEKPLKVRFDPQVKVKEPPVEPPAEAEEQDDLDLDNQQFQCHICLHTFEKFDIFEKHVKLHNLAKSRFYKCKLCEFSSSNLETYCRHVCTFNSSAYISCTVCKRSFHGNLSEGNENSICQPCTTKSKKPITAEVSRGKENLERQLKSQMTVGGLAKPKTQLVRKLTTEGSIEYEEETEEPSSGQIKITRTSNQTMAAAGFRANEIADSPQEEGVVYMYHDKEPDPEKFIPQIKMETDEEQVREIIVPDHLLEQINNKTGKNSPYMLKCSNCEEVLDVRQLPTHRCFLELEAVEFFEVESALEIDMNLSKKPPPAETDNEQFGYVDQDGYYHPESQIVGVIEEENDDNFQPRLLCKTCYQQFPSIVQLREHWQDSGHAWEVGTVNVDVKTIKDKVKDNEQTFRVVKQMFSMKANLPMQNSVIENDYTDEHMFNIKNMFVKVRANNECETCGKIFPNEEILKDHMIDECLTCTYCNIKFLSNNLLKKHYQCTGHWRKIIRDQDPSTKPPPNVSPVCPICNKEFFSRYSLGVHLTTHYIGTNKGACHYCFKEFDEKGKIYQHVVDVHNAQLFKCQHCDKTFLSEWKRDKHQLVKHKCESVECKICDIKFRSLKTLLKHNEQYHREKTCRICGKHISSWQTLRRHEKRHFYEKGLQCSLCQMTFRNKTSLKVHNASHHRGEFKFHCENCDSGFMTVEALEEHKIIHLKSRNVCGKCGKKCPSRTAYWMHKKMHDGPYSCNICGRVFRDTSLLAVHRRKHLRARPYQCPHCPRMFSVSGTLKRHLANHTQAYPFRCALCRRGFITRFSYHKHLETMHNVKHCNLPTSKTASLPLNPTDEDIFQAADTLIADDSVMLNGYQRDESAELITEVVVETTELFDEILS